MGNLNGPERLKNEILAKNLCAGCGACIGLCPYIYSVDEKVAMVHSCGLEEGNCHQVCPRLDLNPAEMDMQTFNRPRSNHILGETRGIYFARAADRKVAQAGQYGGVVSALVCFLLERKKVEAAVLTRGNGIDPPQPLLAKTTGEVLQCAGSKYSASPALAKLAQGIKAGYKSFSVVGRPCQVQAVRKMQNLCSQNRFRCFPPDGFDAFLIGLFCFWSLEQAFYDALKEKSAGEDVIRFDIPPNKGLVASLRNGRMMEIPLDEVRGFIRKACMDCFDVTSEYADLAVGSTEHDMEWNTLIVRTERGELLLKEAIKAGIIEIKDYPAEILPNLLNAVANKKSKVLNNMAPNGYLKLKDTYLNEFNEAKRQLIAQAEPETTVK